MSWVQTLAVVFHVLLAAASIAPSGEKLTSFTQDANGVRSR